MVIRKIISVVIRINEVFSGIVRRVDVNQLDLAGIAFLKQFQHFQVVAFDHQVLHRVPFDAVLLTGAKRSGRWRWRELPGAALAVPSETVLFLTIVHGAAEKLTEHLEVQARHRCLFRKPEFRPAKGADGR